MRFWQSLKPNPNLRNPSAGMVCHEKYTVTFTNVSVDQLVLDADELTYTDKWVRFENGNNLVALVDASSVLSITCSDNSANPAT